MSLLGGASKRAANDPEGASRAGEPVGAIR